MISDDTRQVLTEILSGQPLSPVGEVMARELSKTLGFHKAEAGDMMIAWYPPAELAAALTIEDGEATDDLHVTIVYIPAETAADPEVVRAVTLLCCQWRDALEGTISGTGRFVLDGEQDAFFATVDVPGLEKLREALICKLEEHGVWVNQRHGFTPHMTLKYLPRTEPSPGHLRYQVPISITQLTVAERDGLRYAYDLWEYDTDSDASEIAMAREQTLKAGMDACADCGAPMLKKDGVKVCSKCEKAEAEAEAAEAETKKAAPTPQGNGQSYDYVILPDRSRVVKDADGAEWQYTLGPLYAPGIADAHDEYADDDELHRAVIQYSLKNDRRLKLQHDTSREVGTWVELIRWPYDHTVTLARPGEEPRDVKLPAGTVYLGALWDDDAWAAVKDGTLGGLSLGGRAVRVADGQTVDEPEAKKAVQPEPQSVQPEPYEDTSRTLADIVKWQAAERADSRQLMTEVLEVLKASASRETPAPQVHVVQPAINVEPATAPDVHIAAPTVNVDVAPADVQVNSWQPTKNTVTKRDDNGFVLETETTAIEKGEVSG